MRFSVKRTSVAIVRGAANGVFATVAMHLAPMVPLNALGLGYVVQEVPAWVVAGSLAFWFVLGAFAFGPRRRAPELPGLVSRGTWQPTPVGVLFDTTSLSRSAVRAWVASGGFATAFRPLHSARRLAALIEALRASVYAYGGDTVLVPTGRRLWLVVALSAFVSLALIAFVLTAVFAGVGLLDAIPRFVEAAVALVPLACVVLAASGGVVAMRAGGTRDIALFAAVVDAAGGALESGDWPHG